MIKVVINSTETSRDLVLIGRSLGMLVRDLRPPMLVFADYHMRVTHQTFENGGRGPVKWAPLKNLAGFVRGQRKSPVPLNKTGAIKESIRTEVVLDKKGGVEERTFTKHRLARIHHGGASYPPRTVRAVNARALRFFVGGKAVFSAHANIPAYTMAARPIVFYTDQDRLVASKLISDHVMALAAKGFKKGATKG